MDIRALFPVAYGGAGDNARMTAHEPAMPQPEATAMTLRERYAIWLAEPRPPLQPGDLVIPKPGFDPRRPDLHNQPMLLLEIDPPYSDPDARRVRAWGEKPPIRERFPQSRAECCDPAFDNDCLLLCLAETGMSVPRVYSSQLLTRWDGPDDDTPIVADTAGLPDPSA